MVNTKTSHSLLLVEDDTRLANSICEYLENNGYPVAIENRGDSAVERILEDKPDLVILDLMLPGLDGLEVCRRVRSRVSTPIIMLTALDDSMDQVNGLEIGADDYVIKPVVPNVLLARIRAQLRRSQKPNDIQQLNGSRTASVGNLQLDFKNRDVTWRNKPVNCTGVEFELLWILVVNAGQILSRDFLFQTLNGYEYDGLDRSIDIRVSRIRKKFEQDVANPTRIKSVRGKGYLLVDSAWK